MRHLIVGHLFENGFAAQIFRAQALEVTAQMRFDLFFRLSDEAKAGAIAPDTGKGTEGQRAKVPNRVQNAGPPFEFLQALLAPGQMIDFLGGGLLHRGFNPRIAGRQGLTAIEGLGGDFPSMVYPHQAHGFRPLTLVEPVRDRRSGSRPQGLRWYRQVLDYIIYSAYEAVLESKSARVHGYIIL
jgi:hypothetical protein